ncbi:hypothetical protein ISN45_Aa01g030550 [Arabidopsis thaliana x Arabidopsis arenosa]|uniref:Transmembrane protein n=1 Tax=Arabidopsis thaliana x Arabidopsis arenosa TaxID=1240361 RepID=A0A8T2C5H6_9BRAS|nr:hypothetical protein ISN45_Aa01g030550 [Arabidopsis thaliana x Arabidopsis arenosa]
MFKVDLPTIQCLFETCFYLYSRGESTYFPTRATIDIEMEEVLSLITMIVILLVLSGFGRCSTNVYSRSDFPEGFVFGAGISAYQVSKRSNPCSPLFLFSR